jgi:hypothetical protein
MVAGTVVGIQFQEGELHQSMTDTKITEYIFRKMLEAVK